MEKAKKSKLSLFRKVVQISVFGYLFAGTALGLYEVHKVCALGGIETAYTLITTGEFVQKIHPSSVVLLALTLLITLLFGGVFCGWICPFGTIQELVGKVGQKLFPKFYNKILPAKLDKALRFTRYITLVILVYLTTAVGKLVFEGYDPFHALMNIFSDEVAVSAFVVLGVILVLSLFIERPFCKYACPLGAVIGATSLLSVFKLHRNKQSCVNCKLCDKSCPMNIEVSNTQTIKNHQCIGCFNCTSGESCPVKDTVYMSTKPAVNKEEAVIHED